MPAADPILRPSLPSLPSAVRAAFCALLAWLACLAPAAQAALLFAPVSGSGNAVVFDASTGDGGWVGSLVQDPDPAVADPLQLASVVLFRIDPLTRLLSGQFSFTRSTDLGATLYGQVTGTTSDGDVFAGGGQYALDYTVEGGTGDFAGIRGFGLSFLQLDPAGVPDNYSEAGLLVLSVPEPGTLPLLAGALALLAATRRRRSRPTAR
jgi:hypothetical protein